MHEIEDELTGFEATPATEEKPKKNRYFKMVPWRVRDTVMKVLTGNELKVLEYLYLWSNKDHVCKRFASGVAKDCNLHKKTVYKITAKLQRMGFLVCLGSARRNESGQYQAIPKTFRVVLLPESVLADSTKRDTQTTPNGQVGTISCKKRNESPDTPSTGGKSDGRQVGGLTVVDIAFIGVDVALPGVNGASNGTDKGLLFPIPANTFHPKEKGNTKKRQTRWSLAWN